MSFAPMNPALSILAITATVPVSAESNGTHKFSPLSSTTVTCASYWLKRDSFCWLASVKLIAQMYTSAMSSSFVMRIVS